VTAPGREGRLGRQLRSAAGTLTGRGGAVLGTLELLVDARADVDAVRA
jgi:hypothetical protein